MFRLEEGSSVYVPLGWCPILCALPGEGLGLKKKSKDVAGKGGHAGKTTQEKKPAEAERRFGVYSVTLLLDTKRDKGNDVGLLKTIVKQIKGALPAMPKTIRECEAVTTWIAELEAVKPSSMVDEE